MKLKKKIPVVIEFKKIYCDNCRFILNKNSRKYYAKCNLFLENLLREISSDGAIVRCSECIKYYGEKQ